MYLKSLTIKGFKSFAERQQIAFEPGLAVVVGPNGSGKSNISEAICWALGERNPKNLRVSSLEELIFSGSAAKQAVSVAEVELVLDNSDGTLPVEFNQVSIMRRMYRSGESEYFINRAPCRRMDIVDILFDSGLGQDLSSVIGQGKLTEVLDSKPADRVLLVEDAAGILKHKKRKAKAAHKLDAMDVTLARVDDIVALIDSQLKPLERQAKRAGQYKQLQRQLQNLGLGIAVGELKGLQGHFNDLDKQKREVDAELELANYKVQEKQSELQERKLVLEQKGLFVGDINEQRLRLRSVAERLDSLMLLVEEKGKNMIARLSTLRADLHNNQHRIRSLEAEYQELNSQSSAAAAELDALTTQYRQQSQVSEEVTRKNKAAQEAFDKLSKNIRAKRQAIDSTQNNLGKAQDALKNFDMQDSLLKDQLAQIEDNQKQTQDLLAEKRLKLDNLDQKRKQEESRNASCQADIDKFVRILDDLRKQLQQATDKQQQVAAEIKGLEEIERAYITASPALTWVLDNSSRFKGVAGEFNRLFRLEVKQTLPYQMTKETVESLVEQLMGSDFFGLVIDSQKTAQQLVSALKDTKEAKGALSLLPLKQLRVFDETSIRGERLVDYLSTAEDSAAAVEALLGDVYLVENLEQALDFHERDRLGARFVTPDGCIVWASGKISYGNGSADVEGVVARRRKLDTLSVEAERAETEVGDWEMQVSKAETNLKSTQEEAFELSQSLAKLQGDYSAMEAELERIEANLNETLKKRTACEQKIADVAAQRGRTQPLEEEYQKRLAVLNQELDELSAQSKQTSSQLLELSEQKNSAIQAISSLKAELDAKRNTVLYAQNRHLTVEKELAELTQSVQVSGQTVANLQVMQTRIEPLYAQLEILRAGAEDYAKRLLKQAELEQSDSTNLRQVIKDAESALEDARTEAAAVGERRTDLMVQLGKVEQTVQSAVHRITEDYQASIESAMQIDAPSDLEAARSEAQKLEKRIAGIGAVNQVAETEYENLKARREFINQQVEDLRAARAALTKINRALDRKMKNAFVDTFTQVNRNFSEIFGLLFPGGQGELLVNEDPESGEMGIEVSAQPKGKRITKLSLMSGGEKSLTALALLFAIYQIRHVPFYVLDEVEAALDDSNLQKLLSFIDHLRTHSQIIMISHQRRTMEKADILYGVSMQANSISKIVSQRLEEAIAYAESFKGQD
jgi:chromosome segregation protein